MQLRRGTACGKPAIFKCFDFSRTPAAEEDLLRERDLYSKMTSIQVGPAARISSNAGLADLLHSFFLTLACACAHPRPCRLQTLSAHALCV